MAVEDVVGDLIPASIASWIEQLRGGRISRLERNVSRREGWIVEITLPDGRTEEDFLRLDRDTEICTVKEARVVGALQDTAVPVPVLYGWNDELAAALYSRAPGRADLNNAEPDEQRSVMEHFMEILAALHTLDPRSLGLDDLLAWPTGPYDAAFLEVDQLLAAMGAVALREPLATFSVEWLRRHVPSALERVSLLQGDTGPANFLFKDGRVSAVIDWEWAHFGDPMEDFGNVAYRNMFSPSGNLAELFPLYPRFGGDQLAHSRIYYYRAQQAIRSVIALVAMTANNDPNTPVAMNLAYRLINDRVTTEAIADAMGVTLRRPEPVIEEIPSSGHTLGEVVVDNLNREVLPAVDGEWARYRIRDAVVLVQCMDRKLRYADRFDDIDRQELNELLGTAHHDLAEGLAELNEAVPKLMEQRELDLLQFFARRAYRAEELYRPAVDLFPGRAFGPIE